MTENEPKETAVLEETTTEKAAAADDIPKATPTPLKRRTLKERFVQDDLPQMRDFVVDEIFLPAMKNLVSEVVHGCVDAVRKSVDETLFGAKTPVHSTRRNRGGYSDYTPYESYSRPSRRYEDYREPSRRRPKKPEEVLFRTKEQAENVRDGLYDLLDAYPSCTVGDFYDLARDEGVDVASESFTDRQWGWRRLDATTCYVYRGPQGYFVKLPKAQLLR